MIVDNPVVVTPNAPINRPPVGDRLGGGRTAVLAESFRPLQDPRQTASARRDGESREIIAAGYRRDDVELAGRMRVEVARDRADEEGRESARRSSAAPFSDDFISAAAMRRLRERLEARMAGDVGMITLRSVDVRA